MFIRDQNHRTILVADLLGQALNGHKVQPAVERRFINYPFIQTNTLGMRDLEPLDILKEPARHLSRSGFTILFSLYEEKYTSHSSCLHWSGSL